MKKLMYAALVIIVLTSTFSVRANDEIKVLLNGELVEFKVLPQRIKGKTMVPMREIFQALGATIGWDTATQTVTGTLGNTVVKLTIKDKIAYKNGIPFELEVPAQLVNGKTMVPVRFIGESLGADVGWVNETSTVLINVTNSENIIEENKSNDSETIKNSKIHNIELPEKSIAEVMEISKNTAIHFLKLSHGSAIIIDAGDLDILINAGDEESSKQVISYLKELHTERIEHFIGTQFNNKIYSGLYNIYETFFVWHFFDLGTSNDFQQRHFYDNLINKLSSMHTDIVYGDKSVFENEDGVKLTVKRVPYEGSNSYTFNLNINDTTIFVLDDIILNDKTEFNSEDIKCDVFSVICNGDEIDSRLIDMINKSGAKYAIFSSDSNIDNATELLDDSIVLLQVSNEKAMAVASLKDENSEEPVINIFEVIKPVPDQPKGKVEIMSIDKSGEVVAIKNNSSDTVSLENWELVSVKGLQRYRFGKVNIAPDETIYITSGDNATEDATHYKWTNSNIWNNEGDPGELYNADNILVSSFGK